MKNVKRIASLVLALIMAFAMVSAAVAEGATAQTHNIVIRNPISGHEYTAYQVFAGDLTEDGAILTNIRWGTGINGESLLTALKNNNAFTACTSAATVAKVLEENKNNSAVVEAFADIVSQYVTTGVESDQSETTNNSNEYQYTIAGLSDGYYFVKDTGTISSADAATKYILQVVGDVNIKAKADVPTLEKKIVETAEDSAGEMTETKVDANNGAIGDVVTYELTSKVPAMDGYEKYFFIVHDTLSSGLTFNPDSVGVTLGSDELTKDTHYTVTNDNGKITIVFKNFIDHKAQAGADIVIRYTATINQNAVIGNTGNPNTANLEFSNNPNVQQNGTPGNPDVPGPDDVTGKTPDDQVITYVTELKIIKVDENNNPLTGAGFTISGTALNKIKVIKGEFVEAENGKYYLLNDGTYTETKPNDENKDSYASIVKTYNYEETTNLITVEEEVSQEVFVGEDGELIFSGLGAGDYVITETTVPYGYNSIAPIEVKIIWNDENPIWSFSSNVTDKNGTGEVTIENQSGALLPETGGIGTTLFYVIGGVLVVAAVVLLVTRKRMKSME